MKVKIEEKKDGSISVLISSKEDVVFPQGAILVCLKNRKKLAKALSTAITLHCESQGDPDADFQKIMKKIKA